MLTRPEIIEERDLGRIVIDPFNADQCNPHSYNFCLGHEVLEYLRPPWWKRLWLWMRGTPWCLDMAKDNPTRRLVIPPEGVILYPGRIYLGHTAEYVELHGLGARLEGRSSVGRLGCQIHSTAGFIDSGFRGDITLELSVTEPLRVYAGTKCCQIVYTRLDGAEVPYTGKYLGDRGPKASKLWMEFQQ